MGKEIKIKPKEYALIGDITIYGNERCYVVTNKFGELTYRPVRDFVRFY